MQSLKNLYQHPLLSDANLLEIFDAHHKVTFNKGDFLLIKGKTANSYFCVESGLVRSYVYDYDGNDITTGFIGENEIAIDVVSLFKQVPTVEYFQALTDCECYAIDLDKFQILYHSIKGLNEWGRAWMSESLFQLKQRTISMITDSAAERYKMLQNQHPQILLQSPLKYIASYLGITDTSLSRIRKELAKEM
ncbi:putative transcriptional regulator, Crp/Fnr family [Pseudopedobacter saltans DSM 12145]|uniref:Transcriptional regulator, Crp/Fnr family n=1 Tax=Pseudopedobacter saltans (strain ATCC 51119 / DSM 12145 / JCM 21818 / CCUG 39354 / LMG 10337 / NBRC 100064 / NCIMB 13643) TaxID=762903 RepID=F0SE27_PSESL|nr:Crp/Fnr family transcriptional regulator [Pseudopedobacter saltans]ADY52953.1 putative transcriptional regulator, Crp/Fnr family [Pseudopedobacter saltans DSM 12145]